MIIETLKHNTKLTKVLKAIYCFKTLSTFFCIFHRLFKFLKPFNANIMAVIKT